MRLHSANPQLPDDDYPSWQPPSEGQSTGRKMLMIGLMVGLLSIAAMLVWLMAYDRETTQDSVSRQICESWGPAETFHGPFVELADGSLQLPVRNAVDAVFSTHMLYRDIYQTLVYTGDFTFASALPDVPDSLLAGGKLRLTISPKSRVQAISARIGTTEVPVGLSRDTVLISLPAECQPGDEVTLTMAMKCAGRISFSTPATDSVSIDVHGDCGNPSFGGTPPDDRGIGKKEYSAQWRFGAYDQPFSTEPDANEFRIARATPSVTMLAGIDCYQKVTRSIKYAFLTILLTFMCVFFAEITVRRPIPVLNYLLIGFALVLFYCLLLSFAEFMAFWLSYLVAAVMTVGLVSVYIGAVLKDARMGRAVALLLTLLYLYCFILVNVSNYALLMGSLLLFFALAGIMYGTVKYADAAKH